MSIPEIFAQNCNDTESYKRKRPNLKRELIAAISQTLFNIRQQVSYILLVGIMGFTHCPIEMAIQTQMARVEEKHRRFVESLHNYIKVIGGAK